MVSSKFMVIPHERDAPGQCNAYRTAGANTGTTTHPSPKAAAASMTIQTR